MRRRALKSKEDFLFELSTKRNKGFSIINDSVKSDLQKWIISHPYVIKSPIPNYYIKVKFDDGNGVGKTELCHKVLLQVSFLSTTFMYTKKDASTFSMTYDEKGLYVLVILISGDLFHHNYKKLPSIIKLCLVAKYPSILEYTRSLLIIGARKN